MLKIFLTFSLLSLSSSEEFITVTKDLEAPPKLFSPNEIDVETRITWGQSATNGQFPFAAYLLTTRNPITIPCTGSIISSTWILSARRCFVDTLNNGADFMQAFVGNVDWQSNLATTNHALRAVWFNPPPAPPPQILLFLMANNFPTTQFIAPIRLPRLADEHRGFDGVDITTLGWGTLGNGTVPRILQFGSFRILQVHLCQWNPDFSVNDFCSQHSVLSNMVSAGDWGGASIFTEPDGLPTVIGITSSTLLFPNGLAAISVRVSSFLRFINQHTGIPFR